MPRPTLIERATKYVAAIPGAKSGEGRHAATVNVANALLHGFGLKEADAWVLLQDFNSRCDPPSNDAKLTHRFGLAKGFDNSDKPKCWLAEGKEEYGESLKPGQALKSARPQLQKAKYDPEILKRTAAKISEKVDLLYLANRSVVDPATVGIDDFLRAVVPDGGKVLIFNKVRWADGAQCTQGEALWPDETPPTTGSHGVWWLPQPVDGKYRIQPDVHKNGDPKTSRRAGNCCEGFPYLVIESDEAPVLEWMAVLVQLPLHIVAVYSSGGRSVHALVRIGAATKGHWDAIVKGDDLEGEMKGMAAGMKTLILNGADKGVLSAVRLTRLPGAYREGKVKELDDGRTVYQKFDRPILQKLLYLNPLPDGRPICEIMPRRDVVNHWFDLAAHDYPDADEQLKGKIRRGVGYYAPVSKRCRQAVAELRRGAA